MLAAGSQGFCSVDARCTLGGCAGIGRYKSQSVRGGRVSFWQFPGTGLSRRAKRLPEVIGSANALSGRAR